MKAAVFHGPEKGLIVQDWEKPRPGPGEVLVKVAACGVCHSDLHYLEHGVPTFKKPPLVLGHETTGVVAEVGQGVTKFKEGDKVLLPPTVSCGVCALCRQGRENVCTSQLMFGNDFDGAYAEYVVSPARDAFSFPDELPMIEGCIIADAISTPYHAVKNRGRVQPGDTVVVFGCGGLGINLVQIATAVGASVIAVDIADKKLEWAKKFGAQVTINPTGKEIAREIKKMTQGGVDVAFEVIGNPATIQTAFDCLRTGARLVVVGYCGENIQISAAKLMYREMEIVGSLGCRPVDYPKIFEMVKAGKIQVKPMVTHQFPLEKINTAFELMKKGESLRSVVIP